MKGTPDLRSPEVQRGPFTGVTKYTSIILINPDRSILSVRSFDVHMRLEDMADYVEAWDVADGTEVHFSHMELRDVGEAVGAPVVLRCVGGVWSEV